MNTVAITSKECARCHAGKPIGEYSRDASRRDGLSCYCRECTAEIRAARATRAASVRFGAGAFVANCACGCGAEVRSPDQWGAPRRFAFGHKGPGLRHRLLSQLVTTPNGCLAWAGSVDPKGYGVISVLGSTRRVHRVMWEMFEGPIEGGLELDHMCHNGSGCAAGNACRHRRCANLAHLLPSPHADNSLRGTGPTAINARKTECDSGHEFTEANTYLIPNGGGRRCRTCIGQTPTADDPDYRDLPWHYEADLTAVLADLLDGTDTYRGERTGGVS